MITVTNFTKEYKGFTAVRDLSFTVEAGQILGLVGPNGAGKTTTLRALCGIIPPTAGELLIAGYNIVNAPIEAKNNIGYIPDDPRLFDTMTVWEHLAFTAAAYNLTDFEQSAEALLASLEKSPAGSCQRLPQYPERKWHLQNRYPGRLLSKNS